MSTVCFSCYSDFSGNVLVSTLYLVGFVDFLEICFGPSLRSCTGLPGLLDTKTCKSKGKVQE